MVLYNLIKFIKVIMKKLKNWTVIFKSIKQKNKDNLKSFLNLYNYIYDLKNNHPNHNLKQSHKVVGFENRHTQISKNFLSLQMRMDLQKSLLVGKKSSGRKSSFGKSILLSFPPTIKLKEQEYKKIRDLILIRLITFLSNEYNLNYTKEQRDKFINNYILSSVHLQNNNDHINILVPNVMIDFNNGNKLIRVDLGKRKVSHYLKHSFNFIMLNYFNKDYLDYEIKSHTENKKLNSQYTHKLKEVNKEKEDLQSQIKNIKYLFNSTNENILKIQKRIDIYMNRMETSILEKNKSKFEKNKDLVFKNIEKIKSEISKDLTTENSKKDLSIFERIKTELNNKTYNKSIDLKR